jgi:hypothetical protein
VVGRPVGGVPALDMDHGISSGDSI